MTEPLEPTAPPAPTQTAYPWRATVRTIFAAVVALMTLLPTIAVAAGIEAWPLIVQALVVTGTITRVLAMPAVNDFLRRYMSWLAPAPPDR